MKIYGIENMGPFIIEKVSALPSWTSEDEGRLVYNETDGKIYTGDNTEWKPANGGQTPEGDISIDSPEIGKVIYDNGILYYGDGIAWNELKNTSDFLDKTGDTITGNVNVNYTDYDFGLKNIKINNSEPTGGINGDVWFKYE